MSAFRHATAAAASRDLKSAAQEYVLIEDDDVPLLALGADSGSNDVYSQV